MSVDLRDEATQQKFFENMKSNKGLYVTITKDNQWLSNVSVDLEPDSVLIIFPEGEVGVVKGWSDVKNTTQTT